MTQGCTYRTVQFLGPTSPGSPSGVINNKFLLVVLGCLTALLIYSCSDSGSKSGVQAVYANAAAFEGYVDKYADLLAAYNANNGGKTKSAWGEWHYCNHGLSEGRTYSGLSAASCSSDVVQ